MTKVINQRILNTEIYVFNKDSSTGLFTYSRPITADEGREVAGQVTINGGLGVTQEGVLYNLSAIKGIAANRNLMKQTDGKVWFSTIQEGLLLHDESLLPVRELMDFGIALYDARDPNKEIAQVLAKIAGQRSHALPILASFKSLDLSTGEKRYGVMPVIVSDDGLITGKDVMDALKKSSFFWDSGVHRLCRGMYGSWNAGRYGDLDSYSELCRVGRVSTVGSKNDLIRLVSSQIEKRFNAQGTDLPGRVQSLNVQERECIASVEKVLGG